MYYGNVPFYGATPAQNPTGFSFFNGYQPGFTPMNPGFAPAHLSTELTHLTQRMDLLCQQMAHLTEIVRAFGATMQTMGRHVGFSPIASTWTPGGMGNVTGTTGQYGVSGGPVGMSYEHSALQIRETEGYICWQLPLPNLTLGDVEVEVLGNRIICRTKTVIHPTHRFWHWNALPHGVQFFELPDGRVECSLVIPVAFDADEVEAVFKDGAISIYVPKVEMNQRHSVKIGKEAPQYVTSSANAARKNGDLRA